MDAGKANELTPGKNRTTVERRSDRELVITRTFNGPARIVYDAMTKPELVKRLVQRELYPSKQVLDVAIESGMERGMRETFEQLEDLLAVLTPASHADPAGSRP
jgi:uncharacterized protein YndB with AHSA1/START domain